MIIKRKHIALIVLLFLLPVLGCKPRLKGAAQSENDVEKLQEERRKEAEKMMDEAMKRHMDIQTKDTRKRMKQNRKKAERLMAGKPEYPFYKRIFMKKPGKKKRKNTKN